MTRENFVNTALKYVGYPSIKYRGAQQGITTKGFDCSGFIFFLLQSIKFPGIVLRHCNELFDSFGILVHKEKAEKGDLVFFSNKNGGVLPSHVGILISPSEYIHSPGKDGKFVKISTVKENIIKPKETKESDQIYFHNPIGFKRLAIQKGKYKKILPF